MSHLNTDDLRIQFSEHGSRHGAPVLLLHGWPDDASSWDGTISLMADRRFRLIVPTLRGFGETVFVREGAPRTADPGILAMDAVALMDGLGIERFSVVGHDWGSNVAEALAVGWPDRIEKMVLISSTPRLGGMPTPPFEHAQLDWYQWFMATTRGAEAIEKDRVGFARLQWQNWGPDGWFDEATFSQVSQSFFNPDWLAITLHSYRSRWNEVAPDPNSQWLDDAVRDRKTVSVPTLYIQGQEDGVNPPSVSESVHEKFTGPFERVLLQNVGHFPHREDPEAVARNLITFLQV